MAGVLITMEGVEGSGKSTQLQRLSERLQKTGLPIVISKEPGGTNLGKEVRRLLLAHHESGEVWSPEAELLLFYADRAQHMATLIRPALEVGKIVLVDRFEDSSWAYQGARGIPDHTLEGLRRIVLGEFKPDLTLILDMDPEESLRRVTSRNESLGAAFKETRFDQEALEYHRKVRSRFQDIARKEPHRVKVIPASGQPGEVEDRIWDATLCFLKSRGFGVR